MSLKTSFDEINIVPMIDVILVLLICFMIVTPAINQGVEVDLPQSERKEISLNQETPLFIVTLDNKEQLSLNINGDDYKIKDEQDLLKKAVAFNKTKPNAKFYIRGDKSVSYGKIINTMSILKETGIQNVGLLTKN